VSVVSTALVAASYVGMVVAVGVVPSAEYGNVALRSWVGELIGITVLTPFLLIFATRRWIFRASWELLGLLILTIAAMWLEFGLADAFRFQLFYLFFLPVIWTAVRFGLEGVTAALVAIQVSLIIAFHYVELHPTDVIAYQALMVVLAFTGLAVGVLVNEQHRIHQQLRINQEALSRALRVSTMGELAAALAHEINQPLTAIANYAQLAKGADNLATASEACDRVISQVGRAAEVVRRLRNFVRLGRSETDLVSITPFIDEAISNCHAELTRNGIQLQLNIDQDLPLVNIDALQIQQVIVNLVRNSIEALTDTGRHDGKITIEAKRADYNHIVVRVRDNGPGFDPGLLDRALTPFTTTKQDGLGLGLSLSRTIIEEHDGHLTINSNSNGATVSFTLRAIGNQEATMT
jgi:two-component system sensor kinase FixL